MQITASGKIKNCLFAQSEEVGLKSLLSDLSISDDETASVILKSLQNKWLSHPSADELAKLNHNNMMSIGE